MPTNTKVSVGFRSASRVVSESGRDGSATAIVAAVELLALSKAYAPETNAATAIKIAILFISTTIVTILIKPRISEKSGIAGPVLESGKTVLRCCAANADRGIHALANASYRF